MSNGHFIGPSRKPPAWMRTRTRADGRLRGAKGGEVAEGYDLACEAWGPAAEADDSGLVAFAYLWRRFGPPTSGSDDHKCLCSYVLATRMSGVFLWLTPSGSPLVYAAGYLLDDRAAHLADRPHRQWLKAVRCWMAARGHDDWWGFWMGEEHEDARKELIAEVGLRPQVERGAWRDDPGPVGRINLALLVAMRELLRPVFVRDAPINVLGRCGLDVEEAPVSRYAGYGVPTGAMDYLCRPLAVQGKDHNHADH